MLANQGRSGAKDSWDSTLKSLLNLQSNQTTKASQVLILGHLDFSELYDTLAITKQEKLLKTYRKQVEIIDQSVINWCIQSSKRVKFPFSLVGGTITPTVLLKGVRSH